MDHLSPETAPSSAACETLPTGQRLRTRLSEIKAYGYSPTGAKLTDQQLLIAKLTALGLANKEIAYLADISETTVKAHISAALRSLNLKRRTQLCRYVFEEGLLG